MEGHIHNVEHKPAKTKKGLKEHHSFWRIVGDFILDMLPIIFGILIAVGINSWRERRHDKELEKFYLSTIKKNIDDNIPGLEFDIRAFKEINATQKFFLRDTGYKDPDSLKQFYRFFYVIQPQLQNTGFITLQNTGRLDIISDLEILQRLTTLYKVEGNTLEILINDYTQKYNNYFMPYIINSESKNRIYKMDIPDLERLTASVKFKSIISLFNLSAIVNHYKNIIKMHKDLSKEIELELKKL